MKLRGAAIVIETLIAHGVTDVFGYPGGAVLELYNELYSRSDRLRHILSCHEQGASHAADGYARATGRPGVVIATSGPGATNLVTGIATAYLDSSPLIAITGNVSSNLIGKDSFQEVDIAGITMPVTKHNYIVKRAEDIEDTLCEAFQIACSGRPGPVLVDITKDAQIAEVEFYGGSPKALFAVPETDLDAFEKASKLIDESEKPYIYCGGGVISSGAGKLLADFAERIDAPVGFSMMGLSAMDCDNPRKLGMTGMHGTYPAIKMNEEADLIIAVGVRFSDRATGDKDEYRKNTKIVHIDIDDAEINKNISCDVDIVGNISESLSALCKVVKKSSHAEWNALAENYKREAEAKFTGGFNPRSIIRAVQKFTGKNTIVATDVGQHQMWVAQYYRFSNPRTFLTSGGLGTMGFGMGAAIGASSANGAARTVLFTGDGSFHMNLNEFATAVRYKLPIVVIVMNNNVLGMVRQWQTLFYEKRYSQTVLDRVTDYVKLAEAFGGTGYKAANLEELQNALDGAFKSGGPVIIDCAIDRDEMVLPMIPAGGSYADAIYN
ncbi:MAG: biosynthetic-type acetolactate synthase large subunit [Oscillospiraceae bacterium]|jgi:acetolactate synthase-1/2/3 large subunit|nr:biosynthetic-type acetolactate synthase large subunit [Oscillospiraceae bacterium]